MARDDWFRNSDWNEAIEAAFESKLKRAKATDQYLKIQAMNLVGTHPDITLRLIDRYFAQERRTFDSSAFMIRAEALLSLERLEESLDAYELALNREAEFPNSKSESFVDYPLLVATRQVRERYQRALGTLKERADDLAFPISKFKWNLAAALIHQDLGELDKARAYAQAAIEAAKLEKSGFKKHQSLGLVGPSWKPYIRAMEKLVRPRGLMRFLPRR